MSSRPRALTAVLVATAEPELAALPAFWYLRMAVTAATPLTPGLAVGAAADQTAALVRVVRIPAVAPVAAAATAGLTALVATAVPALMAATVVLAFRVSASEVAAAVVAARPVPARPGLAVSQIPLSAIKPVRRARSASTVEQGAMAATVGPVCWSRAGPSRFRSRSAAVPVGPAVMA